MNGATDKRLDRLTLVYGARVHRDPGPQFDASALSLEEQYELDQLLARDGFARFNEAVAGPLDPTERARLGGLLDRCDGGGK